MKKLLFLSSTILIISLALSSVCFAAESKSWLEVINNDKVITYLDTQSISKHSDNLVSCWIRIKPTEKFREKFSLGITNEIHNLQNTKPAYLDQYVKFDIHQKKYKIFEEVIYSDSGEIDRSTINDSWANITALDEPVYSTFQVVKTKFLEKKR